MAQVPKTFRATPVAIARAASQVPKPTRATPMMVAEATSLRTAWVLVDSTGGQGGSRRAHHFRIAQRESQL